ncbi:MAG: hypothetical protein J6N95_06005 [Bacilli bacterium]|nr:hypothetical protein [Bacilli bacterium]
MAQEIIQINKTAPVGKRRVCAYTRVSSKSEDQENSLTYQIEAYTKPFNIKVRFSTMKNEKVKYALIRAFILVSLCVESVVKTIISK